MPTLMNDGNHRHVNEVMRDMFRSLPKTQREKRRERIEARNREMPKICKMLDIEYRELRPDEIRQ